MIELNKIYNEDCLEGMKRIPDGTIDAIICDLPYGTTANKWDNVIPLDKLWEEYERIIKDNGAIVLFSTMPFTIDLINSNRKLFRYTIIWKKTMASNYLNCHKMPMRIHETICVFYKKLPTYNPIKSEKKDSIGYGRTRIVQGGANPSLGYYKTHNYHDDGTRFPTDVIEFSNFNYAGLGFKDEFHHPTRKPVDLLSYLIRTYSNEGDTILDNCMGSGTTAIACIREKRNFIGFETDKEYYNNACKRIYNEQTQLTLF